MYSRVELVKTQLREAISNTQRIITKNIMKNKRIFVIEAVRARMFRCSIEAQMIPYYVEIDL